MKPPAGCPRLVDGGNGPRQCSRTECRLHLRTPPSRGPVGASSRVRLAVVQPDTCTLDVQRRIGELSYAQIGRMFGVSPQRIRQIELRAIEKLTRALGERVDLRRIRAETAAKKKLVEKRLLFKAR